MAKKRTIEEQSIDPAAQEMLIRAEELGIGTAFTRADDMVPCNIGGGGHVLQDVRHGPLPPDQRRQTGRLRRDDRYHPGAQPDPRDCRRRGRPLRSWPRYGLSH